MAHGAPGSDAQSGVNLAALIQELRTLGPLKRQGGNNRGLEGGEGNTWEGGGGVGVAVPGTGP